MTNLADGTISTPCIGDSDLGSSCDTPSFVEVCNLDEIPLGIEAGVAPIGCIKDQDGNVTGKVFLCKIVDEATGAVSWQNHMVDTAGGAPVIYTGPWEPCDPTQEVISCWKDRFIEGGLDNTFTHFSHTNQTFNVTFSDGTTGSFSFPSASGWTDQVQQMGTGLSGIMPWAQTVGEFCNLPGGCGGLPEPIVVLDQMFARYVGFRVCAGEVVPLSVVYSSDQSAPIDLVVQFVESETIYYDRCHTCGEAGVFTLLDGTPATPVCPIPCSEQFPAIPEPQCSFVVRNLCDNVGEPLDTSVWVPVVVYTKVCDGLPQGRTVYTEDGDGGLSVYEPVGDIIDCDSGEVPPEGCWDFAGLCKCYGSGSGDSQYVNPDNETDGQFSIGNPDNVTIKWEVESPPANSDGLADLTLDIVACIDSGQVANLTITDADGNVYLFPADTVVANGNGDGSGGYVFDGPGTGASGSGKIREVSLVCGGGSNGEACLEHNCETGEYRWYDAINGVVLSEEQVATLEDCPPPEVCDTTSSQIIRCALEVGTTVDGTPVGIGDQLLSLVTVDCDNIVTMSRVYHLTSGEEVVDAILSDQCDPEPDIETVRECIIDTNGVKWTQISIFDPLDPNATVNLYYDQNQDLGIPAGEPAEWLPCECPCPTKKCGEGANDLAGAWNVGSTAIEQDPAIRPNNSWDGVMLWDGGEPLGLPDGSFLPALVDTTPGTGAQLKDAQFLFEDLANIPDCAKLVDGTCLTLDFVARMVDPTANTALDGYVFALHDGSNFLVPDTTTGFTPAYYNTALGSLAPAFKGFEAQILGGAGPVTNTYCNLTGEQLRNLTVYVLRDNDFPGVDGGDPQLDGIGLSFDLDTTDCPSAEVDVPLTGLCQDDIDQIVNAINGTVPEPECPELAFSDVTCVDGDITLFDIDGNPIPVTDGTSVIFSGTTDCNGVTTSINWYLGSDPSIQLQEGFPTMDCSPQPDIVASGCVRDTNGQNWDVFNLTDLSDPLNPIVISTFYLDTSGAVGVPAGNADDWGNCNTVVFVDNLPIVDCVVSEGCYEIRFQINPSASNATAVTDLNGNVIANVALGQFDEWLESQGFVDTSGGSRTEWVKCLSEEELFWLDTNGSAMPTLADYQNIGLLIEMSTGNVRGWIDGLPVEDVQDAVLVSNCKDDIIIDLLQQLVAQQQPEPFSVIEGCILVDGQTVDAVVTVDRDLNVIAGPVALTDFGFVDCCPEPVLARTCMRGWDYQDLATWVPGDQTIGWAVDNGGATVLASDMVIAQDNGFKASWYQNLMSAINSIAGWSISVVQDVASDNSDADDKVTFEIEGTAGETLTIVRTGGTTGDTMTLVANPDGTITGTFTNGGLDIESNTFFDCP